MEGDGYICIDYMESHFTSILEEIYTEGILNEKLLAAILTVMIAFTPIGSFVFQDHATTADAKSYKSGKKKL